MGQPKDDRPKEGYYIGDHQRQDAEIHDPILADGDDAGAREISRGVMRRLGFSEEKITALLGK